MDIEYIVSKVLDRINETVATNNRIPIESSARHVHLSQEHVEILFGSGYVLKEKRALSQRGQYLCEERVRLIGPKGVFENIAILGPARKFTQVELSKTDCISLGIDAPLRESGDVSGSSPILIANKGKFLAIDEGVIIAKRHIHMTNADAISLGVKDSDRVKVKIHSERPLVLEDVLVRCNDDFVLNMHIDFDESNACLYKPGISGEIV